MNTIETIMTRRSIRKFKEKPISKEQVWRYLEAANMAPTSHNSQPWHFYVIEQSKIGALQDILEESYLERIKDYDEDELSLYRKRLQRLELGEESDKIEGMKLFFRHFGKAPVTVMVCIDETDDPWRKFVTPQDAAAAIENLILAAWSEGVGSCWVCGPLIKKADAIKNYFGITDKQIIAFIPLGYPEKIPAAPPKVAIKEKVTWL